MNTYKAKTFKPRTCEACGDTYTPTGTAQKFCNKPECKKGTNVCGFCGETFLRYHRHVHRAFCSQKCHYAWARKYSHSITDGGYVLINVGVGTPGARPDGRILEHRWVMQQKLGRPLYHHEDVHHKDGNKQNNDPDNLE